jgi:DNA polymerase-4
MSCRLIGWERETDGVREIAQRIKQTLRARVGVALRCSIGIAPNRLLAKMAADMHKPDGLTVIQDEDLPAILHPLPLQDVPGISSAMERRLHRAGINTMAELCAATSDQLYSAWHSVLGRYFWHWLHGDDLPEVATKRRSVGHSHVLPPDLRTDAGARTVLIKLIAKAAERLRRIDYWAGRLVLSIEYLGERPAWEAVAGLGLCQDTLTMVEVFERLWQQRVPGKPLRVGVTLLGLVSSASAGMPLFPAVANRVRLARAVDSINLKMGRNAVWYGSMHDGVNDARLAAPTRISFTQIPDVLKDF